jgi:hypothetical protein
MFERMTLIRIKCKCFVQNEGVGFVSKKKKRVWNYYSTMLLKNWRIKEGTA